MNLAPNGKPSNLTPEQYKLVRTPEFKAWFGDWERAYETGNYDNVSKVIDKETKEPLVVYHGTENSFNVFSEYGLTDNGWYGLGFYFTPSKKMAKEWTSWGEKENILECFLNIRKMYDCNKINPFYNNSELYTKKYIKEGFMGSSFTVDKNKYYHEYCVFYPFNRNIKLADGTNTTFDSNNPDIRYEGGGSLTDVNVSYANEQQVNELYELVSKSNELGNVGHPRLVLIQNNKVIGGIFVDNDYLPYEYMFDIFIKKSKRGKGYSKLLLDAMIKDFVENFPKADQIRGWVINKKLEDYLESKYDFWCADDNEEQIMYCYLSKKDAEKLLNEKYFMKGGEITEQDKKETYKKWKDLVNMSASELKKFMDSDEGKEAGLSKQEADKLGIHYGRESAKWILKMKDTPNSEWTPEMWRWAKRQISFNSRMRGNKGKLYDDKGRKTRKHLSLLIWGHNPEKYEVGGSVHKLKEALKIQQEGSFKDKIEFVKENPEVFMGKFADGGELTLTAEQVENKLGRKLHWWNDYVVSINGVEYKKVFLKSEYKRLYALGGEVNIQNPSTDKYNDIFINGEKVGYIILSPARKEYYWLDINLPNPLAIVDIKILKEFRGKNYMTQTMNWLFNFAKENGHNSLFLRVDDNSEISQETLYQIYSKYGFSTYKTTDDDDDIFMYKLL